MAEVKATFDKTIGDPFPHALLRDVFDEHFLEGLKEEVMELHYLQKSNDLYDFLQSNDLKVSTHTHTHTVSMTVTYPLLISSRRDALRRMSAS